MLIWACASIGRETTLHDTERAAMSEVAQLLQSKTATVAVCYPIEVEPDVRVGYWDRPARSAA